MISLENKGKYFFTWGYNCKRAEITFGQRCTSINTSSIYSYLQGQFINIGDRYVTTQLEKLRENTRSTEHKQSEAIVWKGWVYFTTLMKLKIELFLECERFEPRSNFVSGLSIDRPGEGINRIVADNDWILNAVVIFRVKVSLTWCNPLWL